MSVQLGWWAVVGDDFTLDDGRTIPRGALVRYREWYGAGAKLTADVVGRGLADREATDPKLTFGVLAGH